MHHLTSDQTCNNEAISKSHGDLPATGPLTVRPAALKTAADKSAGQTMAAMDPVASVIVPGFACI